MIAGDELELVRLDEHRRRRPTRCAENSSPWRSTTTSPSRPKPCASKRPFRYTDIHVDPRWPETSTPALVPWLPSWLVYRCYVRRSPSAPSPSARRGPPVLGRRDRAAQDLRRSGRHRHRERATIRRAPGTDERADALGRAAHGARRGRPRHQLHPGSRDGADARSCRALTALGAGRRRGVRVRRGTEEFVQRAHDRRRCEPSQRPGAPRASARARGWSGGRR